MPANRKLGRTSAHRRSMLRGMVTYLLENGTIETTLMKAKEVRSEAEKMITLGKKNTLATRRAALAYITKEDVVSKLFNSIAPKYSERSGGYTSIYKLGPRRGDGAEMALIKLIGEAEEHKDVKKDKDQEKKDKKAQDKKDKKDKKVRDKKDRQDSKASVGQA